MAAADTTTSKRLRKRFDSINLKLWARNDLSCFSFNGFSEGKICGKKTKSAVAASPQQNVESKLPPAMILPDSRRRAALSD